jgi:uncharacterized circularly permuted ATP-grasp superfamily protein/uncharacterized alpha-E superfamily protein
MAADYAGRPARDELIAADGSIAAHWRSIMQGLDALGHEQRIERIERINTRVRETGIAHDLFADPARNLQPWHLDLIPLAFSAEAWAEIERGLMQRARLLTAILDDIYGPQQLMRQGKIPPRLVFADPSFLRACHGIAPRSGRIQFLAADLVRGAGGEWRVVDTHAETPAGIGYALANRTVLTRVCGDIFNASGALRLAPFFERMQGALAHRISRSNPTVALLTPGPYHDDFFSHAYLARYLGALLVVGEDLRVQDDGVYLKTLDGLKPIDLVLRCVAASHADALELDPTGFLGPVGFVQAVRRDPDLVVNALGTAIVENRGLGSYLPELCQLLLGEELILKDVTKYWLGDGGEHKVLTDLDRFFIRSAFEGTARPGRAEPARDPAKLDAAERRALIEEIGVAGDRLVAEQKLAPATAPCYGARGLEPKPFAMRVFATAVPGGFVVMPGGLAMTVEPERSLALTVAEAASRDVWVLSPTPQPPFRSLWLPTIEAAVVRRGPREMPSRAADNLFWLGRYVEHADWTFRLLRNCLVRIEADRAARRSLAFARATLIDELAASGIGRSAHAEAIDPAEEIAAMARLLMTSPGHPNALPATLAHIHRLAGLSRDRLSSETLRTLNVFYVSRRWQREAVPAGIGAALDLIDSGLGVIAAFNGLSHENMTRNEGWLFLDLGRRLSRASSIARMLLSAVRMEGAGLDEVINLFFLLELADSFITYRSRYRLDPLPALVLDLLMVDETNPRSLAFQLSAIRTHVDALAESGGARASTEAQRQAHALLSEVRQANVAELAEGDTAGRHEALRAMLEAQLARLPALSDAITRRYLSVIDKETRWVRAGSPQPP